MRRSTFSIALYFLLVFGSGICVGAFGYRLATVTPVAAKAKAKPSPEEWRRQYLIEMHTRLKLTPDQLQHLNSILDETNSRYHDARLKHNEIMKTIKEQQRDKVRAMLKEEQVPAYEKLRLEREAKAKAAAGK